jgi:hypothetical protein
MAARRPVFIVGTGRCGSTLLSAFLRDHPAILSLSELMVFATDLGGRIAEAFPEREVDGAELWSILGRAHPRQTLMLRHDVMMEEALYRPGPGRRFTAATGIPAIAATTLPHLSDAPDGLFDLVREFAQALPAAPIGTQYARTFEHLREMFGASAWVERSGGSLRIVRRLRQHFPQARFVHLVRDGRDAALSMSRHFGFRMAMINAQLTEVLGVDPFESSDRRCVDDLPDDLARFLPEHFDAAAFRAEAIPLPLCGHYWAGEILAGLRDLQGLGEDLVTLHYEDLLAKPHDTLGRFFEFLLPGEPAPDLEAMARQVRAPRSNWRTLSAEQLRQLEIACRPGFDALEAVR